MTNLTDNTIANFLSLPHDRDVYNVKIFVVNCGTN